MADTQDRLNKVNNPEWKTAEYRFEDAIRVEATELFDHLHWKWWKKYKDPVDWGQIRMEAVDIWHFLLSYIILSPNKDKTLRNISGLESLSLFAKNKMEEPSPKGVEVCVRELTYWASEGTQSYSRDALALSMADIFFLLCRETGLTFNELYKLYIGKGELNLLRWSNGYGTTYVKEWFGREDNQILTDYLENADETSKAFKDDLKEYLASTYRMVTTTA